MVVVRAGISHRRHGGAAVAAVLVALVLVLLWPSLVGGKVFSSGDNLFLWPPYMAQPPAGWTHPSNLDLTDPVMGFIPDMLLTRADLHSAILPLWNPYAGAGRPLLASQVFAPLFPLTWLAFVLPFWSSLAWIAAGKLLLAATGTFLFCRALEMRRGPALVGAAAFAFGVYFVVWLEHPQTAVWSMLPWMFFAVRRVCVRGSLGATALLGAAMGLAWLGGHPESAAFLLGATVAYGAFELIAEHACGRSPSLAAREFTGPPWAESIAGRGGLLAAALLLGTGLGAIVTVPLIELVRQSGGIQRGAPPVPLKEAWAFFFPEFWGNPSKAFVGGPDNFNERTAYIGALPLLLVAGTLGRRRPREQWFLLALAVVSLATIFDTPLWANGVRHLPGGNTADLSRLLIIVSFCGAVLAAFGLQRWLTATPEVRRRMLLIMGAAALVPVLVWVPGHLGLLSHLGPALGQLPAIHAGETSAVVIEVASVWRWALICCLGIGGLVLCSRYRAASMAVALAVVLTAGDLISVDHGFHGQLPQSEVNPPVPAPIRYLQRHTGQSRIIGSADELLPNLAERYGLRDVRVAIDVPYPTRYGELWTGLGGVGGDEESYTATAPDAQRLANIFAARYVLLGLGPVPHWLRPVFREPVTTIALNPTALPRAWVAYTWRPVANERADLASTLASSTSQLHDDPLIEGAPHAPAGPALGPTTARVIDRGPEEVTVGAVARRAAYLVLDDSAYPGWQAELDGRPAAWRPANENFRAVAIPAGRHVIQFRYRPASALTGAIVSLLCALALLALALAGALSKRFRHRQRTAEGAAGMD